LHSPSALARPVRMRFGRREMHRPPGACRRTARIAGTRRCCCSGIFRSHGTMNASTSGMVGVPREQCQRSGTSTDPSARVQAHRFPRACHCPSTNQTCTITHNLSRFLYRRGCSSSLIASRGPVFGPRPMRPCPGVSPAVPHGSGSFASSAVVK
jgi:hypothetical protein